MNIAAVHRLLMWCETSDGTVAPVDVDAMTMPPLETHPYVCVRFPLTIETKTYARDADGHYRESDRIATYSASANEELVLAMATGGKFSTWPLWQRFRWRWPARVPLSDALIIASEACERCLNALAYEYGLSWGYPEGGKEWRASKTVCPMCEGHHE